MQVGQFPASAANSLIQGYCDDFCSLATLISQTLEQVSARTIDIDSNREDLARLESGMRKLSGAIQDLVAQDPNGTLPAETPLATTSDDSALDRYCPEVEDALEVEPKIDTPQPDDPASNIQIGFPALTESDWLPHPKPADDADTPRAPSPPKAKPVSFEATKHTSIAASARPLETGRANAGKATQRGQQKASDRATDKNPKDATDDGNTGLKGSNKTMPVLAVFQFLERMRKNGIMTVRLTDEVLSFEFDNGCVQTCHSNRRDKGDRLGDLLLQLDTCDADLLGALLSEAKVQNNLQLGEMVVRQGLATNGQIMDALESQVRIRFARACQSKEATYAFEEISPSRTDGRIRIAPMELAFESSWQPPA